MIDDVSFGAWVQRERKLRRLTQAELGDLAGCSAAAIRKIEADERRPSREVAEQFATVFHVPDPQHVAFVRFARGERSSFELDGSAPLAAPAPTAPHDNLPAPLTSLVGRVQDVAAVGALLHTPAVRLVTLLGPGGVGKTRLALQVAADVVQAFADGVCYVDLAPISDPALVPSAIANALGVTEVGGRPLLATLTAALRPQRRLLVLDNFEQVVEAAPVVAELLTAAARLKILVTSREVLQLYGEQEYPVPPLAVPALGATTPKRLPVEDLAQYAAVELFLQRVQAVRPDFRLTPATAPAVAEICVRLDGLPLAIELAAARVKLLPPAALLQRLDRRLTMLTGGSRSLPQRQQTLRATIDWSYGLLTPGEQTLFARLAVFAGGWTLDATDAVCNPDGALPFEALDGLAALRDHSLVRQVEAPDGEPRFGMLETIHEYAWERLLASGEAPLLQRTHAQYFRAVAEAAEAGLYGAAQLQWSERLAAEHNNLRAALSWAVDVGHADTAWRLAGSLGHFWELHCHIREGRSWLEQVIMLQHATNRALNDAVVAKVYSSAGTLAWAQGDYHTATALHRQALRHYQASGDPRGTALATHNIAVQYSFQREYVQAAPLLQEALGLFRQLGDHQGVAWTLCNLGVLAMAEHDVERARGLWMESLELSTASEDTWTMALNVTNLGWVDVAQRDADGARKHFCAALTLLRQLGDQRGIAECLEGLGGVAALQGDAEQAARLFGAAGALREVVGVPVEPYAQRRYADMQTLAAALVDAGTFSAAWSDGARMSVDEAVASVLSEG